MRKELKALQTKLNKLTPEYLMRVLKADKAYNAFVISMNRSEQLAEDGVDISGKKLHSDYAPLGQAYARNTILGTNEYKGKIDKSGLAGVTDHVTLFDTGAFYKSFKLVLTSEFDLQLIANDVNDLEGTWGKVIGLTDENYKRAIERGQEILRNYVHEQLTELGIAA